MAKLTPEEEAFGGVFWHHVGGCIECMIKTEDLRLAAGKKTGKSGYLLNADGSPMDLVDFGQKLCPVAGKLVRVFYASRPV